MLQDSDIGIVTSGDSLRASAAASTRTSFRLLKKCRRRRPSSCIHATRPRCAAPCEAAELGIIVPILVGPLAKITAVAEQHGIDIARYELVDAPHSEAAAAKAVELIRRIQGRASDEGQPAYR